jgi:spermidine synthase
MSLLSYLFPRIIARYSSPINRDIRVLEEKGKYKLLVNGSRQSGEYVQKLWQHAFCEFGIIPSPDVCRVLVLGVAGGTVIHLIHAMYPDATIDGIDIDAQMISIGKKYFGLESVEGLTLTVRDAKEFIRASAAKKKQWDMIIVDLFIGATIPTFVGEESFLRSLKSIMTTKGMIIINYLQEREYGTLSELLFTKLTKNFRSVQDYKVYFNRFFVVK